MFESRVCVLPGVFGLAEIAMIGRLMVMMHGGVVASGRQNQKVSLTRRTLR